jgi:hypothetical protein
MSEAVAKDPRPIGQAWLRRELIPSTVARGESYAIAGASRSETHGANAFELYPCRSEIENTIVPRLCFTLGHEMFTGRSSTFRGKRGSATLSRRSIPASIPKKSQARRLKPPVARAATGPRIRQCRSPSTSRG